MSHQSTRFVGAFAITLRRYARPRNGINASVQLKHAYMGAPRYGAVIRLWRFAAYEEAREFWLNDAVLLLPRE